MGLAFAAICFFCAAAGPVLLRRQAARILASNRTPQAKWSSLRDLLKRLPLQAAVFVGVPAGFASVLAVELGWHSFLLGGAAFAVSSLSAQLLCAKALYRPFTIIRANISPNDFSDRLMASAFFSTFPIALSAFLIGIAQLAYETHLAIGYIALGLTAGSWVYQWSALRVLILPGRSVPFLSKAWEDDARALAKEMGVPLSELLLIQTRTRSAGAFALGMGRVAITDYLLSVLDHDEFLAIIAHELQHFKQRKRTILFAFGQIILVGSLGGLLAFAVQTKVLNSVAALAAAGVLAAMCFVPLMKLRARNEDEADQVAAMEVGAMPLMRALAKAHALNGDGQGGAVHRSLESRLNRICELAGIARAEAVAASHAGILPSGA